MGVSEQNLVIGCGRLYPNEFRYSEMLWLFSKAFPPPSESNQFKKETVNNW